MKSSSRNILDIFSHCEIYVRIIVDTFGSPKILSGLEFELSLTKDHLNDIRNDYRSIENSMEY